MKVKIKTWKQMEKEFGLKEIWSINCDESFVDYMEEEMPKDRIINVELNDKNQWIWNGWLISSDMILKYY